MGKAAAQRKTKRMKVLSGLAKNSPDIFEREWDKRINSWMMLIGQKAGKLRDAEGKNVAPVFGIVAEAIEALRFCGEETFRKYGPNTYEVLNNECTRQLATRIDSRLSLTNNFHHLEEMSIYHVR